MTRTAARPHAKASPCDRARARRAPARRLAPALLCILNVALVGTAAAASPSPLSARVRPSSYATPSSSAPSSPPAPPSSLRLSSSNAAARAARQTLPPAEREIERQRARLASGSEEERRDAVTRLGAMLRADASRAAAPALRDRAHIIRATAARAVTSLPPAEAAGLLVPLLNDKDEFVRREAAYALGLTGSTLGVEALALALARDKESSVRGAAAVALGQIGDARAAPLLSEALGRRVRRTGFLNRITFRRTEENEFVRRAAAVALGQIKSREGVPALIAALSNERAGDDVRREAARALGLIGDPAAVPALRAAATARDPYLSEIALEALRKLEQPARPA